MPFVGNFDLALTISHTQRQMINNTKLELPFLTARQLLQSRRRLKNTIRRGRKVAKGSDLLEQIDGELQSRGDLRFQNASKKNPPLYRVQQKVSGPLKAGDLRPQKRKQVLRKMCCVTGQRV